MQTYENNNPDGLLRKAELIAGPHGHYLALYSKGNGLEASDRARHAFGEESVLSQTCVDDQQLTLVDLADFDPGEDNAALLEALNNGEDTDLSFVEPTPEPEPEKPALPWVKINGATGFAGQFFLMLASFKGNFSIFKFATGIIGMVSNVIKMRYGGQKGDDSESRQVTEKIAEETGLELTQEEEEARASLTDNPDKWLQQNSIDVSEGLNLGRSITLMLAGWRQKSTEDLASGVASILGKIIKIGAKQDNSEVNEGSSGKDKASNFLNKNAMKVASVLEMTSTASLAAGAYQQKNAMQGIAAAGWVAADVSQFFSKKFQIEDKQAKFVEKSAALLAQCQDESECARHAVKAAHIIRDSIPKLENHSLGDLMESLMQAATEIRANTPVDETPDAAIAETIIPQAGEQTFVTAGT